MAAPYSAGHSGQSRTIAYYHFLSAARSRFAMEPAADCSGRSPNAHSSSRSSLRLLVAGVKAGADSRGAVSRRSCCGNSGFAFGSGTPGIVDEYYKTRNRFRFYRNRFQSGRRARSNCHARSASQRSGAAFDTGRTGCYAAAAA